MSQAVRSEKGYEVRCCIAGCGPAGAMLGLLLARAGVDVLVLEKHGDFLRDFRGDTIHPSTLEILHELGLAERFLQLPHTKVAVLRIELPDEELSVDLRRIGGRFPFIAFVPQWDFLDFVTGEAARYPGFELRRNAEVVDLIEEGGVVRGVRYRGAEGEREVRALLTVGADGRGSRTRTAARLPQLHTSPPMDVWWFRLSRRYDEPPDVSLHLEPGHIVVLFNRSDYWQVGYVIPKGADERARAAGLDALRRQLAEVVPELADRVDELRDWDQIKLLTVRADRLTKWYRPGYLAIGDAAHAMSPIGGVGINIAIQDAVAAANALWHPLQRGSVSVQDLAMVQRQREPAVRVIQWVQSFLQDQLLRPAIESNRHLRMPLPVRLLFRVPWVREIPARLMAYGVGRPHVHTPALARPASQAANAVEKGPDQAA